MCVTKVLREEGRGRVERYYSPGVFILPFYPNEAPGGEERKKLYPRPEKRQTPQPPASSLWVQAQEVDGLTPQPGEVCGVFRERS